MGWVLVLGLSVILRLGGLLCCVFWVLRGLSFMFVSGYFVNCVLWFSDFVVYCLLIYLWGYLVFVVCFTPGLVY